MPAEQFGANDRGGSEDETITDNIGPSDVTSSIVIGPYHLLQLIGVGGMGEVWLAEQKQPVRRRVAVKLIKAGMDTHEVVARFESERQALALMDHPAIAKVFDAGTTPDGRPYFVMEYVAGIPITDYCDKHKLTTRQRLELFVLVCEGVQHAHQKAIIHRDLKPSNILVAEVDRKPMPRIIDFGVAKAILPGVSAATMFTRVGTVIGTIDYMSPEQADSGGEDIDTRSDVYSLGVVLYELLVGERPLDFGKLAFDEVLHRLREQEAPRPSTKLRTLGGQSAIMARNRGVDPPTLVRQLRGDADAIALRALEKDRARRYSTPSELAADIGRYLRNEPVNAHPPSAVYRAVKYVRRHRLGVAAATAVVVLLVAFAVTEAVELRRITRERNRADRIAQYMMGMFQVPDPSEARGNTITAREILDQSSKSIESSLSNDPELQAKLMCTMAETYWGLGLFSRAQALLERALEIQRRVLGPEHPDTLLSSRILASVLENEGHHDEAEKMKRQTLAIDRRVLGPDNDETLRCMSSLTTTLRGKGDYAEAEKLDREIFEAQRRVLGPENRYTLLSMSNLAADLTQQGLYAEAEKPERDALDMQRRILGLEDIYTQATMNDLASVLIGEGHYAEAEKLEREVFDIQRRVLGPEHPRTLDTMSRLTNALLHAGHYAEAEKLAADLVNIDQRVLGPEHPSTLWALEAEAVELSREGRYRDAEKLFREALQAAGRAPYQDTLPDAWYNFACGAAVAGRRDDAIKYLSEAMAHGYNSPEEMAGDADLKSLYSDPRFEALVAQARQVDATKPK
jgi:eukaryotic-like serine/threonine-protein kinase